MVGDSLQSYTYAGDSPVTSDDATGDLCADAIGRDVGCPTGGGGGCDTRRSWARGDCIGGGYGGSDDLSSSVKALGRAFDELA